MLEEVKRHPDMETIGGAAPFLFDEKGNLKAA